MVTKILFCEPTNIPFISSCGSNILCLLSKVVLFMSFGLLLFSWCGSLCLLSQGWVNGYMSVAIATLLTEILSHSDLGVSAIFKLFFFFSLWVPHIYLASATAALLMNIACILQSSTIGLNSFEGTGLLVPNFRYVCYGVTKIWKELALA